MLQHAGVVPRKNSGCGVRYHHRSDLGRRGGVVKTGNIVITKNDYERLLRLINSRRQSGHETETLDALEQELERASIVSGSELPGDVVTMNSHVRVKDLDRNDQVAYRIVF